MPDNYLLLARRIPEKWIVRGYFMGLLLLGAVLLGHYGVSWDEYTDRQTGMISARYVAGLVAPDWAARQPAFAQLPDFATYSDNDHGVLFETPLCLLELLLGVTDSRTAYLLRHAAIFLTFVGGVWALYRLARLRFHDWRLGLAASTLLLLSPRFFAESFYNNKDLVFLAAFTLGVYTLARLLRRPTLGRAAVHGLATAAATDIRLLGCLLVAMTLGMVVLELVVKTKSLRPWLRTVPIYLLVTVMATVAGWPYLWAAPLANFLHAFRSLSSFAFDADLLYLGEGISINALPWHYIPVWVLITTPVAYSLAALLGALTFVWQLLRSRLTLLRHPEARFDLLFLGWLLVPVFMVIVLHSVVYDGWRHLYFIYPALLLLALRGATELWRARRSWSIGLRRGALALAGLAGLEGAFTLGRMVLMHPFEHTFFAFLPAEVVEQQFERDYWGLSYRAGLRWILAHDPAARIDFAGAHHQPILNNLAILPAAERSRLQLNPKSAKAYYLTTYRTHPEAYPDSLGAEVYELRANGVKILSVFQKQPTW